jgi:hypothetical protein
MAFWAALCGAAACAAAVATHILGPPAVDAPAHLFHTWTLGRRGFQLWDNFWYAGSYESAPYSLLYYPLAVVEGIVPVAVVSAGVLAVSFAVASALEWGARVRMASLLFSVSATVFLMSAGMYPFLTGAALGMGSLVAIKRRHPLAAAAGIVGAAAMSPLAFLLLAVVLVAGALSAPRMGDALRGHWVESAAVAFVVAGAVVVQFTFHQSGRYPFSPVDLGCVAAFAITGVYLLAGRARGDMLRNVFLVYLAVNVVVFLWPGAVGGNAIRLFSVAGTPLLWVAAVTGPRQRPRTAVVGVLVVAFVVQGAPYAASAYRAYESQASAAAAFWQPALRFLRAHPDRGFRVEVVATASHWEAYYLPKAGVPLARGWFRQDDFPGNHILYQPRISAATYRHWLRTLGVRYVLLPRNLPLDYSSASERRLLLSGRSGLATVSSGRNWTFYELPHAVPIATGPAAGDAAGITVSDASIRFHARTAGRYRVRVHTSPYWQVSGAACIADTRGGMLTLSVTRPGLIALVMPASLHTLASLIDHDHQCTGP